MRHVTVFAAAGTYAGWPANHGAWQRGDEFLVGFLTGEYKRQSMHNIAEPYALRQARSLDGGLTWRMEETGIACDDLHLARTRAPDGFSLRENIIRVRGVYDHGGDFVAEEGGFYASRDFGHSWHGPYAFVGLEDEFSDPLQCTARTAVLLAGDELVFLSSARRDCWGTDDVFCAQHSNGRFKVRGRLDSGKGRCVMPAVAQVGERFVAVCRRRITGRYGGWVEAFASDDCGRTWRSLGEVGETGKNNGNPPALIAVGTSLVCAYANRTDCQIVARKSDDGGATWSLPVVLRVGTEPDIGYPRLFLRSDGGLVCVYYWAGNRVEQQHIAATHFAVGDFAG